MRGELATAGAPRPTRRTCPSLGANGSIRGRPMQRFRTRLTAGAPTRTAPAVPATLAALAAVATLATGCGGGGDGGGPPAPPTPQGTVAVALSPASLSIGPGGTGSAAVTVSRGNGFAGAVALAVDGVPSGVQATF